MIIVTGAAGFIGSNLVRALNRQGHGDILAVDNLTRGDKFVNLAPLQLADYLDKEDLRLRLAQNRLPKIAAILHQGACSDTTERNGRYMMDNNYRATLEIFEYAQKHKIPLLYASSAAVYGAGPQYVEAARAEGPLNVYGYSKLLFDQVLRQRLDSLTAPVVGLRYFNVYGPGEQHKGRMASVARHNMVQYQRLFDGWDGYAAGGQMRDFIHVDDVVAVNLFFLNRASGSSNTPALSGLPGLSGIFNCGTGRAQPFNDVAATVINTLRTACGQPSLALADLVAQNLLRYIPFPEDLKGRYQSHTQADLTRLRGAGFDAPFMTVQAGVAKYVQDVLACPTSASSTPSPPTGV